MNLSNDISTIMLETTLSNLSSIISKKNCFHLHKFYGNNNYSSILLDPTISTITLETTSSFQCYNVSDCNY